MLRRSGIRPLFLWPKDARANYSEILEEARVGVEIALQHVVCLGSESWAAMLAGGIGFDPGVIAPNDVANIQYTSGTTGSPKGVLLTHRNLINNGWLLGQGLRLTEADRICVPVPLYHCFGCVIGTMVAITSGAAMILPSAAFDALATLEAVEAERATALYGVPTMFIAELHHPEFNRFDLSSLRTGIMAGAPCPVEVMRRVIEDMHCAEVTIAYGQTESSPVITMSAVDDFVEQRVSTVGRAMPNTEVKVVSQITGGTVAAGVQGELCARGYLLMAGYDQDPDATALAIDGEGWLHTGDLAVMREDGYLRITGRAKDMIIRGGENIYPREVEEFLYTHPQVADVQVVGLPDEKFGEIVAAWVRLKPEASATEEEIRTFCKGRIAHFKIPQHVRFVEEFPMTVTGKIQKFKMREFEVKARGLESASNVQTA